MRVGIRVGSWMFGLLVLAVLVGCDGRGKYVGAWTVDKQAVAEAMNKGLEGTSEEFGPLGEALAQEMTRQLVSGLDMTLEVKRDGTWAMSGSAGGAAYSRTGRWTMSGGELVMTGEGMPEVRARIKDERLWVDREKENVKLVFVKAE